MTKRKKPLPLKTTYAIEIRDRWLDWHVACNLDGHLFVFQTRNHASNRLDSFTRPVSKIARDAQKEFGIEYRVRPFREQLPRQKGRN